MRAYNCVSTRYPRHMSLACTTPPDSQCVRPTVSNEFRKEGWLMVMQCELNENAGLHTQELPGRGYTVTHGIKIGIPTMTCTVLGVSKKCAHYKDILEGRWYPA